MVFNLENVKTTVDIQKGEKLIGLFGYFSNNINDLEKSIVKGKTILRVAYGRLNAVLSELSERRFDTSQGNFSLFYPIDSHCNEARY